jgi:hypothetical protein
VALFGIALGAIAWGWWHFGTLLRWQTDARARVEQARIEQSAQP